MSRLIKIYNDLTRKKESFKVKDKTVKFYSCGPTIYDYAHIGIFRTFSYEDLLVRLLKFKNYKVIHVRNLTDIDDKIIKAVRDSSKSLKEYTDFYANEFFSDLKKLRHLDSDFYPRATEYVDEIVRFIGELASKGYAYKGDDNSIYFNIKKFKDYGKLSRIEFKELKDGASNRVKSDDYKDDARDFALWKSYTPTDGKVFWETRFGKGRPGWHIECSVMANTLLGETIDIHSGGEDLVFPHHENEIAQSEAHNEKPFAKYWMHAKHLLVENKKMSKSVGNFYTLRDLEKIKYNPLSIKLNYFMAHYSSQQNFTLDALKVAQKNLIDINLIIEKLTNYFTKDFEEFDVKKDSEKYLKDCVKALEDDLNSPNALAILFEFKSYVNGLMAKGLSKENNRHLLSYFKKFDQLFGLFDFPDPVPKEIIKLGWERYEFRKAKDFNSSDKLRDELKKKGYQTDDLKDGFTIVKVK